jgi:hypothetical protein
MPDLVCPCTDGLPDPCTVCGEPADGICKLEVVTSSYYQERYDEGWDAAMAEPKCRYCCNPGDGNEGLDDIDGALSHESCRTGHYQSDLWRAEQQAPVVEAAKEIRRLCVPFQRKTYSEWGLADAIEALCAAVDEAGP